MDEDEAAAVAVEQWMDSAPGSVNDAIEHAMTMLNEAMGVTVQLGSKAFFDTEAAHGIADDALMHIIRALGLHGVAAAYKAVPKWYA